MNFTKIVDRLGRIEPNPFFLKELRQAVRSRYLINTMLVYLGAAVLLAGGVTWAAVSNSRQGGVSGNAGQGMIGGFAVILFIVNLLIATYLQNRIAAERNEANVDLFFLTAMSPAAIVRGKLLAGMFLLLELYGIALPFFAFAYLLRGVDILSICTAVLILLALGAVLIALALLLGVLPLKKQFRNSLLAIVVVLGAQLAPVVIMLVSAGRSRPLLGWLVTASPTWAKVLLGGGLWLAVFTLVSTFAVTALSPHHSNRFLPVRINATLAGIVLGAICAIIAANTRRWSPLILWHTLILWSAAFYLALAVNEPEDWSPRIRRRIPRRWFARAAAFPFFTGAANAVAWILGAVILAQLPLLPAVVAWSMGPGTGLYPGRIVYRMSAAPGALITAADSRQMVGNILCFAYILAYSLFALMIRRLLSRGVRTRARLQAWTWATLLFSIAAGMMFSFTLDALSRSLGGPSFANLKIGYLPSCYVPKDQLQHALFLPVALAILGFYHLPWFIDRFRRFIPADSAADPPEASNSGETVS